MTLREFLNPNITAGHAERRQMTADLLRLTRRVVRLRRIELSCMSYSQAVIGTARWGDMELSLRLTVFYSIGVTPCLHVFDLATGEVVMNLDTSCDSPVYIYLRS